MTGERTAGKPAPDDLYERLKAFEGRTAVQGGEGRDPVNEPMIRHWCEAMGDTNPAYPDIAPPTMLQAWTMGGLAGHPAGSTRTRAYDELFALLDDAGCTSIVATDCEQEYPRPLRPGDRVRFDAVIESVSPRKNTALGSGHFVTTRMDIHVGDELVGTHRFRVLTYAPAHRNPKPKPKAHPEPVAEAARPRPVVNRDNAGFWEGVAEHRLLLQRCTDCGTLRFPWLPGCGRCGSPEWETAEASGRGTVFSHVVMHHPPFPAFDPPYAVGLIELAEGVRMVSGITGVPYDKVRIGMPVELEFLRVDDAKGTMELPVFRATAEEAV
ncbi:bifunctional MaoC family dehydratase N-terminal/OB-fold nucleic acid binding domain-containing protein [Streptomyces coffeae]|uniref:Bifunctional MaoC family dehydratase/OB-fold nucleic acid binding domain-containing protein n=1 Tax=Streptomyces coffeae TaxID=621382 RepID=A0ABS1N8U1_9ACTN|nr:bifunctional MaoC family dehydratase N-terminal/OB-fold nucleic acid binding domain-containing protein [Streptomyces coffeae]MBL1096354.1 bifunctional MaoC family dehydratase/OB-fold nucleic acid binding domain-containing protein [Streptomyces coffeae]